ncbi:hypothetical protein ACVV37_03790 [Escherichia coli]
MIDQTMIKRFQADTDSLVLHEHQSSNYFINENDYSSDPLRLMGECNRSYVAPRLGALLGSQIRLTEVQIEPAVNYDKPAHYTYLTTERKRIASKVNSLWVISQVRSAHF